MSKCFKKCLSFLLMLTLLLPVGTMAFPASARAAGNTASGDEFKDVTAKPSKPYYYDAVYWAVRKGITGGVQDPNTGLYDTFAPDATCTRAQMVTFLWRMAGCPDPVGSPAGFKDVAKDTYYYKATLWGKQTGIVGGYDDGTFRPQTACSRGQAVTFLWRLYGCPEPETQTNAFSDNRNQKQYFYKAVLWANENGITGGYSDGTFKPANTCSRAQMVSFLFRCRNKYFYHIVPLLVPFNEYFFVYTNNPDRDTFSFVDESSKYSEEGGSITPVETQYADVVYENADNLRVKGGFIASGSYTDGGMVRVKERRVTGTIPVHNLSTGEVTYQKTYQDQLTTAQVKVYPVKDETDYLIAAYSGGKTDFFERLTSIQSSFDKVCLYSGVYVLGDLVKSTSSPYCGLSTSPHVDQNLYIQYPYSRKDNKSMLISSLYPFRYDSLGFPSMMASIAKRIEPSATTAWNTSAHYLMDITYKGVTKTYGGAGTGGGQGILKNQVKYRFRFDKSKSDAATAIDLNTLNNRICEYGKLTIPEERENLMTYADVRNQVGDGTYVRLILITSIFGGNTIGYTYLYDNGSTSSGYDRQAYGAVGYFSNAWYDGRYFNKYEYFYPGATLEQTVQDVKPSLVFKNQKIKFPSDGKEYYYNYTKIENVSNYNASTGVWKGYTTYTYDESKKVWTASILSYAKYRDPKTGSYVSVSDPDFIDACTITMEEAKAMKIDRNTNVDPKNFLIYDMKSKPGTAGTN